MRLKVLNMAISLVEIQSPNNSYKYKRNQIKCMDHLQIRQFIEVFQYIYVKYHQNYWLEQHYHSSIILNCMFEGQFIFQNLQQYIQGSDYNRNPIYYQKFKFLNNKSQKIKMSFQIESLTHRWLSTIAVLTPQDKANIKKNSNNTFQINEQLANKFQNGLKIAIIVQQLCRKNGFPIPNTLTHLKTTNHTAAMLYNWNILNQSLKKMGFQIDSQTKNMIINGDRDHLNITIRNLQVFYQSGSIQKTQHAKNRNQDSLQNQKLNHIYNKNIEQKQRINGNKLANNQNKTLKQSMSLSYSQQQPFQATKQSNKNFIIKKTSSALTKTQSNISVPQNLTSPQGDLLQYIVNQLMVCLKLTRKQAIALLSDNNKYLAHVLVKGIKGEFVQIDQLMQKLYTNIDYIIQKMIIQNDMCFFFLQILKPSLLSKSEEIAQWGCRILSKVANQLAQKQMLPLAYDWFVRQAGGLSTTILALSRHPKLNQHVVGYILQFARYNVTQLFTIQLKKITNNDNINYIKFMLLIFQPLVESKLSAQQLLSSGAIDYWVQIAMKNSQNDPKNSKQLRLYSIQFLIKIWRAYPLHIEQTLDQVNQIMINIKKGILQSSQIMRFSLLQIMFSLLQQFASKKNPYASILYKKLTFLFVQNHEQQTMRQFILSNLAQIFKKFSSIPVQIFLQPFVKQVKITQNKSYFLQLFDLQFIKTAVQHKKLKVNTGIELYDLLAKIKLNNYCYVETANQSMGILLDRFMEDQLFFDYTVKLVKISLAMFYSTLKHKKQFDDHERLQAQKRAQIINFIISLIQKGNQQLNQQIKNLVVHVKIQIQTRLAVTHKGIQTILSHFSDIQELVQEALQNLQQTQSNATTKTKDEFRLPKIQSRNQIIKQKQRQQDQINSQQSYQTNTSKFSRGTNRSKPQFQIKQYTQFADENQKKFMKQNNIPSMSKKNDIKMKKNQFSPNQKQMIDPKLQSHIAKLKQRKQQEQVRKFRQKQILQRKKQILKQKIQKQLQQRNIKEGVKGNEKDVQVQVIFQQNQLNQKLFQNTPEQQQVYFYKNVSLDQQQQRDGQSIRMILRKNMNFLKKIFSKYACAKIVKKDYFEQKTDMNQADLLRLCKQKNLQKSKQPVIQILKQVNKKNIKSIDIQTFPNFIENLCIYLFLKQKTSTHIPMGDFLRQKVLKKMAVGQNVKLDDEQQQQTKSWTQKIRYNPHIELPQGFKKITQRIYYSNNQCTYPVKKSIKNQTYLTCFQVLNQILFEKFQFNILEQEIRFKQELKVVAKKQAYLPPKPTNIISSKKQKQQEAAKGLLLKDTQSVPLRKRQNSVSNRLGAKEKKENPSVQKQNNIRIMSASKQRNKKVNAAQKKKLQDQQNQRIKREHQQQLRKIRQMQVKKKLQKQKQLRQKQKQEKKQQQKRKKQQQDQKKKQQLQQQQKYKQKQKQKVQKYRKQQQQKQQAQKQRKRIQRQKQDQQKKQKLSIMKNKQTQKRQEDKQKSKKQRELSQQNKKKHKQDEQKKKESLRKQVLKKLQNQKQKYQIEKNIKQITKKIYTQNAITSLFSQNKQQLKAMFNYGKQYNQYKLGANINQNQVLQQKGFIILCQQFNICDVPTANKLLKTHQKDNGSNNFTYQQFQQFLFSYNCKPVLQRQMQNYQTAVKEGEKSLNKFIAKFDIPKDKLLMKDFFLNLKNQKTQNNKKRKQSTSNQQIQITNKNGDKQSWQIQNSKEQKNQ